MTTTEIPVATAPRVVSPLLDKTEAAAYCRVSEIVLMRSYRARKVAAVKCGKTVMFTRAGLDAWIAASTVRAVR